MHFSALHQSTLVLVLSSLSTTFANPVPQEFDLDTFGDEYLQEPSDLAFANVDYQPSADDAGLNLFDDESYKPLSSNIVDEPYTIAQGAEESDCIEWEPQTQSSTTQQQSIEEYRKDPLPPRPGNGGGNGGDDNKKTPPIKLPKPEEAQKVAPGVVKLANPKCGNKKAACKSASKSGLTYTWIPFNAAELSKCAPSNQECCSSISGGFGLECRKVGSWGIDVGFVGFPALNGWEIIQGGAGILRAIFFGLEKSNIKGSGNFCPAPANYRRPA